MVPEVSSRGCSIGIHLEGLPVDLVAAFDDRFGLEAPRGLRACFLVLVVLFCVLLRIGVGFFNARLSSWSFGRCSVSWTRARARCRISARRLNSDSDSDCDQDSRNHPE